MSGASESIGSISCEEIARAVERIGAWVHKTPVLTSKALDDRCGGRLFLKCENFQRVGAFKFRGAMNAILQLSDAEKASGAITHSSGNHAQAVALAGKTTGVATCVVMPSTAPAIKRAATEGYGARVVACEPTLAAREQTVADLIARHGYTLIHPFDDWRVIAGQGTAAWELLDQAGPLDLIVVPVGGGGLLAGTALAVEAKSPGTNVAGAEPSAADDARRSLAAGTILPSGDPRTVADGLRTSLGKRPYSIISRLVKTIAVATDREILDATRFVWERFKIVVEPSAAVPIAAILNGSIPVQNLRVGVIVSGGNLDLEPLFSSLIRKWVESDA